MTITVTFDSMEEFIRHLRPMEGFEDDRPDPVAKAGERIEQLKAETAQEAASVPEGFEPAEDPPFEKQAPAITEDFRVEVRKALAKLNKQTGENTAKTLIGQVGYKKLSDVPLEKLPELMAKVEEAANG